MFYWGAKWSRNYFWYRVEDWSQLLMCLIEWMVIFQSPSWMFLYWRCCKKVPQFARNHSLLSTYSQLSLDLPANLHSFPDSNTSYPFSLPPHTKHSNCSRSLRGINEGDNWIDTLPCSLSFFRSFLFIVLCFYCHLRGSWVFFFLSCSLK